MSLLIKLSLGEKHYSLPRDAIALEDLVFLFGLKEEGLHVKVNIHGDWKNISAGPRGLFSFPPGKSFFLTFIKIISSFNF